jgi:hypothetical protein
LAMFRLYVSSLAYGKVYRFSAASWPFAIVGQYAYLA